MGELPFEEPPVGRRKWPPPLVVVTAILLELVLFLSGMMLLGFRETFSSDLNVWQLHLGNGVITIIHRELPGSHGGGGSRARNYRVFPITFYVTPRSDTRSRHRVEVTFQLWFLILVLATPPARYLWRNYQWRGKRVRPAFEVIVDGSTKQRAQRES